MQLESKKKCFWKSWLIRVGNKSSKNEASLRERVVIEVVAVDIGKQLVQVKRKNGQLEWLQRKDVTGGESLKLLKQFEGGWENDSTAS